MKKFGLVIAAAAGIIAAGVQERGAKYAIAYNVLVDADADNYDVFRMNLDGSGKRNVTRHPDVAWAYYAWGNTLYFISDRDTCRRCYFLYATDDGGETVRKVTDLRLEDSWMSSRKDGGELVVTGRIDTSVRFQLYLVNASTGAFSRLTGDTSAMYADPLFLPDGNSIVYRYRKNRRDRQERAELWVMDLETRESRQLTRYPADDTTAAWHSYHAGPPRWHPTGKFISYQSKQRGKYRLFGVTPDGNRNWELMPSESSSQGWHDWSPDGEWLAFEGFDASQSEFDIYLVNWRTKKTEKLTDSSVKFEQAPVFMTR